MDKTYEIKRTESGVQAVVKGAAHVYALPMCLDIVNHSPTGFEYGYLGSGPAQLALALCFDALGDRRRALSVHQHFKERYLAGEQRESFTVSAAQVQDWVRQIEAELHPNGHGLAVLR